MPREDRNVDPLSDPDDDGRGGGADGEEEVGAGKGERRAGEASQRPQVMSASLGLSVLIPPGTAADTVTVVLRCAEYKPCHRRA